ncbi:hypothetical protein GCM10007421_19540 [Halopseudomonas oceani]|uniref:Glycosyl transferase family 1 domain-containing protein n=1 Tax=Halopseudomonas oceani TaxID=1708783 RepID=A0A2P4EVE1_9GAMM|nr:glycosyltransferase [Halopseudomonas oceani]POB03581.1 hypothetical protein C1949_09415 [Halopseudomonas oceani]GGE45464.1 hypothetical protein GCM10007421_19540 [Halopseudomonas oceani]
MKRDVVVSLEHRFYRFNGDVYTLLSFSYDYWEDYLAYFDSVLVVARVKDVEFVTDDYVLASGPNVKFSSMPYYVGPRELIRVLPKIIYCAFCIARDNRFFLLRSGNVSNFLWVFVFLFRRSYLREYPGDIKAGIMGVAGKSLFVRMVASFLDWLARIQGRYSKANSYVSNYCKSIYGSKRPSYVFSSFRLDEISSAKKDYSLNSPLPVLISVGRLEGEKGHSDLMLALHELSLQGHPVKLCLVGDGRQRDSLSRMSSALGVCCEFFGAITDRDQLFRVIRSADIFILPSITEGMPRALLESMALGMPCIGTRVGGIPEVLDKEALVDVSDSRALAEKILEFLSDADKRKAHGLMNLDIVQSKFGQSVLQERKFAFWGSLHE